MFIISSLGRSSEYDHHSFVSDNCKRFYLLKFIHENRGANQTMPEGLIAS